MPTVNVGNKVYGCGGYLGHTGCHALGCDLVASNKCYVYTHLGPNGGTQWSSLPDLPGRRAGGGLWYKEGRNSLITATGADAKGAPDDRDTWELSLSNIGDGWVTQASTPYGANHVGSTSVTYGGVQRHFIMGGQYVTDEYDGNSPLLYEYIPETNTWTHKKNMTKATGHISASTIPYKDCGLLIMGGAQNGGGHTSDISYYSKNMTKATGHISASTIPYKDCGLLIMGGAQNGGGHTSDISYYSIGTDTWTKIGDLKQAINSPVCAITGDWLYCQSGNPFGKFSWRVMIGTTINPALLPAPSSRPSRMLSKAPSARPSKMPAVPVSARPSKMPVMPVAVAAPVPVPVAVPVVAPTIPVCPIPPLSSSMGKLVTRSTS